MDSILILGSGTQGLATVSSLKHSGYRVVLLCSDKNNYADKSRCVDKLFNYEPRLNDDELFNTIVKILVDENIKAVLPMGDGMAEFLCKHKNDIEKWKDKLNWDLVSKNKNIIWSSDMIAEFADMINWNIFSRTISSNILSTKLLEVYKDRWDWKELSWNNNLKLSFSLIDKYIDRWDWNGLISIFRYPDLMGQEFYNRYKNYIPHENITKSWFYHRIVSDRKKELMLK